MKRFFLFSFMALLWGFSSSGFIPSAAAQSDNQNSAIATQDDALKKTLDDAVRPTAPALNPYADLPQEYIDEAQQFYNRCQSTGRFNQYYNCKCLATKYLDRRIAQGPEEPSENIVMDISTECADATLAAGTEYQQCMNHAVLMPLEIPVEKYCSCYANTFAKLYEQGRRAPNSQTFTSFQTQAYVTCRNPEMAKKLYPQMAK